jgi:hypothetical protein
VSTCMCLSMSFASPSGRQYSYDQNYHTRYRTHTFRVKFKIMMPGIEISVVCYASDFFIWVANCRNRATKAVEATESVRSRR